MARSPDEEGDCPSLTRRHSGGRSVPLLIEQSLSRLLPGWPNVRLCVALSGGVDSVVLLAACAALRSTLPAILLRAMHVHHGLQPEADGWQARCEALCTRLDVPFEVLRLALAPRRGESIEAEARDARYAALAARLAPGEALLTAHHEDDQLETVLLQLVRGAGVAGLAAMPGSAPLGAGLHLRPMLGLGRADIEAHARAAGLDWVEDPMNSSERFDRGYLRQRVTPALRARWPAAGRSVARSTRHLAEARGLLEALAALDAAVVQEGDCLRLSGLLALGRPRQANLLRWWLAQRGLGTPSTARLEAILDDVLTAGPDRTPVVTWPTGEVRRYRDRLHAMRPLGPPPAAAWQRALGQGESVELPCGLGTVALERHAGPGLAAEVLLDDVVVRFRRGGERLRPMGRGGTHSLTALCQEAGVPPWERDRLPILAQGNRVLAIGDRWMEQRAVDPGRGWRLRWSR